MDPTPIDQLWEELLDGFQALAQSLNQQGSEAFLGGDYELARQLADRASQLEEFCDEVRALFREWKRLEPIICKQSARELGESGRLPRGLATPQEAFRRPLLEALVELGGEAPAAEVLALVEQKMQDKLNEFDWQPLPSDPRSVRWRRNVHWCRSGLAQEGLIRSDAPRGIWGITDRGREELARLQQNECQSEASPGPIPPPEPMGE